MNIVDKISSMIKSRGMSNKRGSVDKLVNVVLILVLAGALAVTALTGLFNMSTSGTGIPTWAPLVLGIVAAIGLVKVILKAGGN